ncbi:polysaccharide lyase family 8 super-sandwich domain-containing protein [Paenibacillus pseudetheri]|uniref:BIG2 domain-containing protein n=1 Tax=Paenibacillus pseudetheri TaxID=2897682 RepID=A0ABM9BCA6_9BACL|nr:polysaccharide lyase family 8 super-sandwich domain-containing protein [Paenibacillus pseudetheri]CAH1056357.1 hypothetical protein PAECIP111894_02510 [Paenibacillus pseudetheri]
MKKYKKHLSTVLACSMTLQLILSCFPANHGVASANTAAEDTVANGSFETVNTTGHKDWVDGVQPTGWNTWLAEGTGKVSVTGAVYHSGQKSVQIEHQATARTSIFTLAPVTAGQTYKLSAWLKLDNVVSDKGVYIRTQIQDSNKKKIADGPATPYIKGMMDWTQQEKIVTVPANGQYILIEMFLDRAAGNVWLDDLSLTAWKGITALALDPVLVTMGKDDSYLLRPIVTPADATDREIVWRSSNSVVASVYDGQVTAHDYGSAMITAATKDGRLSATSYISVESDALQESYETVRQKWRSKLVGGQGLNMNDQDVAAGIEALMKRMTNAELTGRWDKLNKAPDRTYLWDDVIYTYSTDSWRISWAYGIIRDLSLAYSIEGSALYHNKALKNDIIGALEWMHTYQYNETKTISNNWWDWEIGAPQALMDILVLMYDDLTPAQIDKYLKAIDKFVPDPKKRVANPSVVETGANLLDKALVVTLRGVVGKAGAKVEQGRDAMTSEFLYVKSGDGIYEDGSLVQHFNIAYTGGYGAVLMGRMADLFYLFASSPWELTDPNAKNVYRWASQVFEPLIYKGAIMDMVKGRSISRAEDSDHLTGRAVITTLLRLAEGAPPEHAATIKRMVKAWVQADTTFDNYYKGLSLYDINLLKTLMEDASITPKDDLTRTQMFAGMDRAIHVRPGFGFGISLFSDRISAFEYGNGENKKGWYTGIGMTSLYNNDLKQYSDQYWPTVDMYRLPGTTTDGSYQTPKDWAYYMNSKDWVGGSTLDQAYGAVGMAFSLDKSTGSTLQGKKSWFLFDDEVVALGSDISSSEAKMTETIVENRRLSATGSNMLTVNGVEQPQELGWQDKLPGVEWAHLEGNVPGSDVGYIFPAATDIVAKREARTGSWRDIHAKGPVDPVTRNYMTLAIEHGQAPKAGTYAYVVLPGKTKEQTENYSARPDIKVLSNTGRVHAVRDKGLGVTAINFWEADAFRDVRTDQPISITMKENGDEWTVAIADPTQKQAKVVVDLGRIAFETLEKDERVNVLQTFPYVRLEVNTQGSIGASHKVKFRIDPSQTIDLEAAQPAKGEKRVIAVAEDTFVRDGNSAAVNFGTKNPI